MKTRILLCSALFLLVSTNLFAATITPGNLQGWGPQNVRNSGTVAITTADPRSGLGSLQFTQLSGADKADYELDNLNPGGFGLVKDITSVGYEFYRSAASTCPAVQAPVLRLGVYDPISATTSLLIWEPAYNGFVVSVPTDTWVTNDCTTGNWWMRAFGSPSCSYEVYDVTLPEWVSGLNNGSPMTSYLGCTPNPVGQFAWVYAINVGIGSGWNGTFNGAIDNVTIAFNGQGTTYNFEPDQVVPTNGRSWGNLKTIYR